MRGLFGLLGALAAASAPAATGVPGPIWGRAFLAAGAGGRGDRDGAFGVAQLRSPEGLALSADGSVLYVADTGNRALRKVALAQGEAVSTLPGGPSGRAWVSPTALAVDLEDARLLVADAGSAYWAPTGGGPAVPAAVSGAAALLATSVVREPSRDVYYAWDAPSGTLSWVPESGPARTVGRLGDLAGADGPLVCTDVNLYLLRRSSGELFRLTSGGTPLGGPDAPASGAALAWDRVGRYGPAAGGVAAQKDPWGGWTLWVWDAATGLFHRIVEDNGQETEYPLRDYEGRWIDGRPGLPREPFGEDPTATGKQRSLFVGPLSFVQDPARQLVYVAEADAGRVVGLSTPDWAGRRPDGMTDYTSGDKAPGVTRILVVGDSMLTSDDPDAGDLATGDSGFGRQLEVYLNLFASLKGTGRRYQVLQQSVALGALGGGVTSYLANLPDDLWKVHPDVVATLSDYLEINCELTGMARTQCPDDVCWNAVDPEFRQQTPRERMDHWGPLHRAFLAWLAKAPAAIQDYARPAEDGTMLGLPRDFYFIQPLGDPDYRAWALKVEDKAEAAAAAAAKAHQATYVQFLLPFRNQMTAGELSSGGLDYVTETQPDWLDADLARLAAEHGIAFFNLGPELRAEEPTFFPLVAHNIHHYTTRGLRQAAIIAAWQVVDRGL